MIGPMRIVHITHQYLPETRGGVESYVHDIARTQRAGGNDVCVLSGSFAPTENVSWEEGDVDGVPVHRLHRFDLFFDSWDKMDCPEAGVALEERLRALRPDVIHVHHWIRLTQDLVHRLRRAGWPVVVTLHDLATTCPRGFRIDYEGRPCSRPLGKESCRPCVPRRPWWDDVHTDREIEFFRRSAGWELRRASMLLCSTEALARIVTENHGLDIADCRILPLAYRPRFVDRPREVGTNEPFRFAYWGAVTPRKGVDILLRALRSLTGSRPSTHRPVTLEVFGAFDHPSTEKECRGLAEGLPVTFHGPFDYADLPVAGLSAAVFPSRCFETYGLVLDEAFELGLPAVVPDIGAFPERLGEAGLIFEAGDPGDLARKMGALVDDPSLYEKAKSSVLPAGLTLEEHARRLAEIYAEAIASPDSGREVAAHCVTVDDRRAHLFRQKEALFRHSLNQGG